MQTEQRASARSGRRWRFFAGSPTETAAFDDDRSPDPVIDLEEATEAGPTDLRIDRLEAGIRLLAEALKRVHQDLSAAVADLRADLGGAATVADVQVAMAEVVLPLQDAVTRLTESTQSLPLILGAATERLASKVDATRVELEETLLALMAQPQTGGANGTNGRGREREIWGSGPGPG